MKLREFRERANKTQTEIATFLGVSRQCYNNYELENREPNTDVLIKLAKYFNVSVDDLLGIEEKPGTTNAEPKVKENVVIFSRNGEVIKKEFTEEEMNVISTMLESLKGVQNEDL